MKTTLHKPTIIFTYPIPNGWGLTGSDFWMNEKDLRFEALNLDVRRETKSHAYPSIVIRKFNPGITADEQIRQDIDSYSKIDKFKLITNTTIDDRLNGRMLCVSYETPVFPLDVQVDSGVFEEYSQSRFFILRDKLFEIHATSGIPEWDQYDVARIAREVEENIIKENS